MLVTASGGQTKRYNEQVATPCGEPIKRHTVPVTSAVCYQVTQCAMSST